jgi:hypothetical protein
MCEAKMVTLTDEELIHIFAHQLPDLLERRPDLEPQLYFFFLKAFVRKEDMAAYNRIIEEYRTETKANFERIEQHFEQNNQFQAETRTHFEQIEQRLDTFQNETKANFEGVNQRFEQVDQRFEQVDQRFEQVDQRFEQVDQRFEQVDQRFDQIDREFEKLRAEMAAGFKEVTRQIDQLGARWGIRNESLFRSTVAAILEKSFGVAVETRDIKGEQFDLIITNGQHILVEIAASVRRNIVERLERKRRLYAETTSVEPYRFILAVASIHSRLAQSLREAGFEVIEPEEELPE